MLEMLEQYSLLVVIEFHFHCVRRARTHLTADMKTFVVLLGDRCYLTGHVDVLLAAFKQLGEVT